MYHVRTNKFEFVRKAPPQLRIALFSRVVYRSATSRRKNKLKLLGIGDRVLPACSVDGRAISHLVQLTPHEHHSPREVDPLHEVALGQQDLDLWRTVLACDWASHERACVPCVCVCKLNINRTDTERGARANDKRTTPSFCLHHWSCYRFCCYEAPGGVNFKASQKQCILTERGRPLGIVQKLQELDVCLLEPMPRVQEQHDSLRGKDEQMRQIQVTKTGGNKVCKREGTGAGEGHRPRICLGAQSDTQH